MKQFFQMVSERWRRIEQFYLDMLQRSQQFQERKHVPFYGRLAGEPRSAIDGPYNARMNKSPFTTADLMMVVIAIGLLVAICFGVDWNAVFGYR